jgi:hypothetical protein
VLIECSETPSIRSSPTRSIHLPWNYLHSPNNDNTNNINQDHIPEGFCVKVHTVVGDIGQLMMDDDLHILNDLRNIPAPWLSLCISHSTAHPNQYRQVGYCSGCGTHSVTLVSTSGSCTPRLFISSINSRSYLQPNNLWIFISPSTPHLYSHMKHTVHTENYGRRITMSIRLYLNHQNTEDNLSTWILITNLDYWLNWGRHKVAKTHIPHNIFTNPKRCKGTWQHENGK